ncbi:uncharacterized protein si:dkey-21c1.4 isoform X2 [Triplophysa rosa]|nr:uncharacterized protein si:dkey-21c1.4 isoform X2 [Triplophysa rosa]
MAPFAQPLKSTQTPQDLPKNAITSKQKINKKILTENNYLVFDDRQTSNDRRKEELIVDKMSVHNAESSIATTEVTAFVNTERPQNKWSAKRQKEYERFQKLAVLQKSINYTSVSSDHERDKSFHEISNGQEKGASQTNGTPTKAKKKLKVAPLSEPLSIAKSTTTMPAIPKSTNLSSEWSLCCENPKCTVMAEMEPNSKSSDLNLVSRVKELKALTFFTSKTSVWDHIKGSLYYKRSCNLLLPCPVLGTHTSDFETKYISVTTQLSKKLETTKPFTPSFHFSETSIQRPVEDVHSSRLQGVRSLGWNPEIMTSFRILFSSEPFRNSSDDNMWKKHPFSGPSSHSEVLRLIVKERHLHQLGWTRAIGPLEVRNDMCNHSSPPLLIPIVVVQSSSHYMSKNLKRKLSSCNPHESKTRYHFKLCLCSYSATNTAETCRCEIKRIWCLARRPKSKVTQRVWDCAEARLAVVLHKVH